MKKTLNKINLKNSLYIKYVKKAHDVTDIMNPKLGMYFLHSLHGQFSVFDLYGIFNVKSNPSKNIKT